MKVGFKKPLREWQITNLTNLTNLLSILESPEYYWPSGPWYCAVVAW
jgi:hypothetical protein